MATFSSLKRVKKVTPPSESSLSTSPQVREQPKPPTPEANNNGLFIPLEDEPSGTPTQRGFIGDGRAERLRLQLWLADNIRKSMAPDLPLDLPFERTPEREQMAHQRIQQVIERKNVKIPSDVSTEQFYDNVCDEIFGFGPLEPLIRNTDISEIMVNGPYIIFIV